METKRTILLVEYDRANRTALRDILSDEYRIFEAESSVSALEMLDKEWESIALTILDMEMPITDGEKFLAEVKADYRFSAIPVIVTTGENTAEDEVKALEMGALDFISKPYKSAIVQHRVRNVISMRETAAIIDVVKYDQVSGLYNKEYFYKAAEKKIAENPDMRYDILCCDVEKFHRINVTKGYEKGNKVLCAVATTLTELIPNGIFSSRLDSDIFALLLPHGVANDATLFTEIQNSLNEKKHCKNVILKFGVYTLDDPSVQIYTACSYAASVIEKVKNNFINKVAYYDEAFHNGYLYSQWITEHMESALKNKEFVLYYQPTYNYQTEQIVGAEALVRWISPTKGMISPGEFIPLFESNGFITELDKYVWEEACIFLRHLIDSELPFFPVSVNVSRSDFYATDIVTTLTGLIEKYDLQPEYLHLEITESSYTDNPETILAITNELRELGFVMVMDDFGAGYSSLNMLGEMTLDILKLDMVFARTYSKANHKQQEVLLSILGLAGKINLQVIVEGVETKEQSECFKNIGCDQVQGFYFSRPVPQAEYESLLKKDASVCVK